MSVRSTAPFCIAGILCFLISIFSVSSIQADEKHSFSSHVQPILTKFCVDCHNADEKNADVDFSKLGDARSAQRQRKLWRKALLQLETGQMPPVDAEQLSQLQRQQLQTWMKYSIDHIDPHDPANQDPGPQLMRRLSLAEYNNSLRDLLGFSFDTSTLGMTSEAGEGNPFGNRAQALEISSAQLDKYFAVTDKILDRLFGTELSSDVDGRIKELARESREMMFSLRAGDWRNPNAEIKPPAGMLEREAAEQIITKFARRAYRRPVNNNDITELMQLYDAAKLQQKSYVASVRIMLKVVLVSPHFLYRVEPNQSDKKANENYPVSDVALASRLSYFLWSSLPDERLLDLAERGVLTQPGPSNEPVAFTGNVISEKGSEKYQGNNRDKVFDGNRNTFLDVPNNQLHWVGIDLGKPLPITMLKYTPRARYEQRMIGGKFQASSTADFSSDVVDLLEIKERPTSGENTLRFESAKNYQYLRYVPPANSYGNIAELKVMGLAPGTVLEQEVSRMLRDKKARALTNQFATHWLQLNLLPTARPSREFFPEFDGEIRLAMQSETTMFFDHLRKENRSLLELLDADYTFLNSKLASYYGIPRTSSNSASGKVASVNGFEKVSLKPEHHRGGLLGMGSILAITSHTSRTSPTLRGKWVLDTILGTPPPPPPANVSMLKEEEESGKEPKSFREKLSQHATNATCAACHKRMDPLGFALDNYNAVGKWREKEGNHPLDVSGVLPTGEKFSGAVEIKQVLLAKKQQFIQHLTEQMLSYALGRDLDFYDDGPVREITNALEKDDYRFSTLIVGVAKSYPFLNRKNHAHQE